MQSASSTCSDLIAHDHCAKRILATQRVYLFGQCQKRRNSRATDMPLIGVKPVMRIQVIRLRRDRVSRPCKARGAPIKQHPRAHLCISRTVDRERRVTRNHACLHRSSRNCNAKRIQQQKRRPCACLFWHLRDRQSQREISSVFKGIMHLWCLLYRATLPLAADYSSPSTSENRYFLASGTLYPKRERAIAWFSNHL